MKHFLFLFTGIFLLFPATSHAVMSFTAPQCFREVATLSPQELKKTILIESPYDDILAKQGDQNTMLAHYPDFTRYDNIYKNIPFSSNITQKELTKEKYHNMYQFDPIDSDINREIILSFEKIIPKKSFHFHFSYDSQYFSPKYYISEDGENYSQVLRQDISDYNIQKIKIHFFPLGKENIREIIKIRNLAVTKDKHTISFSQIDITKPLKLYQDNSCGQTRDAINIGKKELSNVPITPVLFHLNPLYKENTTDTDHDGISDLRDNCKTVKNRDQKDLNQNGVGDACEFDSDKDSIPDEIDNCRNAPNPLQEDDDKDWIGNVCDNCKLYNPRQTDSNNNGVGDVCDADTQYRITHDEDTDGVVNYKDNCKKIANPHQEDSDSDGIGDACDNCKNIQNPHQEDEDKNGVGDICEDSDGDGIDGLRDNCRNVPNPDQKDSDNDGIWDVCEDDDGDGIIFSKDNCPYTYNPKQEDFDTDGVGDVCDESDDRFLESNKAIFIFLMCLIIAWFIGAIVIMVRKLQK